MTNQPDARARVSSLARRAGLSFLQGRELTRMRRGAFLAAAVFISAAAVRAQDAYPVTIKEAVKGDVRLCDVSQRTLSSTKIIRLDGGQALHEKTTSNARQHVYRETVLERQPGQRRPTRLRRQYEKA